jgi:hypothetical protein
VGPAPRTKLATVLGGPSLRAVLDLAARIREAASTLRDGQVQVFGWPSAAPILGDVAESDLVLPPDLGPALLSFVDDFARTAGSTPAGGPATASLSSGMLLLGRPGTGKTLTIRHVLGCLEGCRRYLFVPAAHRDLESYGRNFQSLVQTIAGHSRPAVVIVEDIDRLFDSGSVAPQYFLNVLDGLLRPGAPILWIATCNDPSDLPENLTDRPGRFDRIFVFEAPGPEERTEMLHLYHSPRRAGSVRVEVIVGRTQYHCSVNLQQRLA